MKKISLLLLLTFITIAATLFTGCGNAAPTVSNGGKNFVLGFDASFPPYGFKDEKTGEYKGFDLDLAEEVCKRNGWILEKRPIDWAAKDMELNSGVIDCIWNGFTMNEDRKDKYEWTEPYVKNLQVILVRKDSTIVKLADLNGKIIVSQDGSSGADAIKSYLKEQQAANKDFAFQELKLVPDYLTAATMLKTKVVDAIALDSAVAGQLLAKNEGEFLLLSETVCDELYGIGFKKGNTVLRDKVQETLKGMVADGTVAKILTHWATQEVDNDGAKINFILK